MYELKIGDKTYTLSPTLGAMKRLQAKFGKPYAEVLDSFERMEIEEQEAVLYCALAETVDEKQFLTECDNHLYPGEIMRAYSIMTKKAINPEKSLDEIEQEYNDLQNRTENFRIQAQEAQIRRLVNQDA